MTDLSIYFQPNNSAISFDVNQLGSVIESYIDPFPELNGPGCALISVPEFRGANKANHPISAFRSLFYRLHPEANWKLPIYDLGTIEPGASIEDTYFALAIS